MGAVKYTDSQKRAIESRGSDVLVSAGAGSGKTTVLTERIISRIKEGCGIEDFLVVTFTNSAAADLKEKLYGRIAKLCSDEPSNMRYRRQLYLLSGADICTIDAFCLKHVRRSATALGYGGASVGDEALCNSLLCESAEAALDEMCDADDSAADLLLDNFASHKSDDGLIQTAVKLYGKLRSYPFYADWLEETVRLYTEETNEFSYESFFNLPHGMAVKRELEAVLERMCENASALYDFAATEKESEFADKVCRTAEAVKSAVEQGYAAFYAAMSTLPKFKRPNGSDGAYKASYEVFTGGLKELKAYLRSEEELSTEYKRTASVLWALKSYVLKTDALYTAEKKRRGIMDFADAEQIFLGLLLEKTPDGYVKTGLCRRLSAAYKEVFVDEYQDVSPLQDALFMAIGQGKRFMVGDAKQSIYAFRNAYPDLFLSYRNSFADSANANGERIFLKENFRCDKPVIDFCNYLFGKIYNEKTAGSDYKSEALVFGKDTEGGVPVQVRIFENSDGTREADEVADEAARLIMSGTVPSDIAVLVRKNSAIPVYAKALADRGIAVSATAGKDELLSMPEVLFAASLLRVVDNPTDDISLAAVLRSPAFCFTAEELTEIRHGGISLYDDLRRAAKGKRAVYCRYRFKAAELPKVKIKTRPTVLWGTSDALSEKCALFLKRLELYRTKSLILPVHKLLWFLYDDVRIFEFAPQGRESAYRRNLFSFYSLAMGAESGGYKGVSVFTDYLRQLEKQDSSPKADPNCDGDGVRVMTVHGSKGLEFPVVFVSAYGGKMNKADRKSPFVINYKSGISIKLKEQAEATKQSTLLRDIELAVEDRRCVAEEIRVLYVALTRAKKRLYLTASASASAEGKVSKYSDLFVNTLASGDEMFYNMDMVDCSSAEPSAAVTVEASDADLPCDIELPRLDGALPAAVVQRAKYSASSLKQDADGRFVPVPEAMLTDREPTFATENFGGALVGTANHLFMQYADFARAETDVVAEADRLVARGFVSAAERELMDTNAIARFFKSRLYAEIKCSPKVYREKRFSSLMSARFFSGADGESVMVQGVIDCFFENADGTYSLVDYKTDSARLGDEALLVTRHKAQLDLYRMYIEKLTGRSVKYSYIYSFALGKAIAIQNFKEDTQP